MIRVALGQIDPTVGDIDGNVALARATVRRATEAGAQLIALPELAVTGYPPEDLVLKRSFVRANVEGLHRIAEATGEAAAVVGFVDEENGKLYNAAAICHRGAVAAVYRKQLLPNYGVFDERRYFEPGDTHLLFETSHGVVGVCVCEDAWSPTGPVVAQGDAGAQLIVNINASPFHKDKLEQRCDMLGERARRARASIVYVNCYGGQDELVFDGGSVVVDPEGSVVARLPQFEESFALVDVPLGEARHSDVARVQRVSLELPEPGGRAEAPVAPVLEDAEEVYRALVLALRDYVHKNGFRKVAIGLSGGIDSALTAVIAADAIGAENVLGVTMPSEFSSSGSVDDSKTLASNLGIAFLQVPIAGTYRSFLTALDEVFEETEMGLAEENLQARIRGTILMTISNRYGHLVVATGNKSEMACGYATLYGDMAGGFALLRDVFKTEVYALARWRNRVSEVIPEAIVSKAPSAELRPGQKDSDSLPPYEVLDPILEAYIERDEGVDDIVGAGGDRATVERVIALVDRAEFKRRQAPPGPKVTSKAFGRDRRLPVTSRWREGGREPAVARTEGPEAP